jgi:hypothetical protein
MTATKNDTISDAKLGNDAEVNDPILSENSIDPENEITGVKLILIHIGLCLSTFLVGLVCTLTRI